ncbi:MAG: type I restriction enzyme HsdR N-terminal domain-containing protein [Saprospiraceae bacterium]
MLITINYLAFQDQLKLKSAEGKSWIFDPLRRKYLVAGPEELVRQLVIFYFIQQLAYNKNRIKVEMGLKVNTLARRCDILVYDNSVQAFLLVECKAPKVDITQATFEQIARYNMPLQVPFLMVTNGIKTYCCQIHYDTQSFTFLDHIPPYPTL